MGSTLRSDTLADAYIAVQYRRRILRQCERTLVCSERAFNDQATGVQARTDRPRHNEPTVGAGTHPQGSSSGLHVHVPLRSVLCSTRAARPTYCSGQGQCSAIGATTTGSLQSEVCYFQTVTLEFKAHGALAEVDTVHDRAN